MEDFPRGGCRGVSFGISCGAGRSVDGGFSKGGGCRGVSFGISCGAGRSVDRGFSRGGVPWSQFWDKLRGALTLCGSGVGACAHASTARVHTRRRVWTSWAGMMHQLLESTHDVVCGQVGLE
eukprot:351769-Chlamydomonas_euryale.AAC.2